MYTFLLVLLPIVCAFPSPALPKNPEDKIAYKPFNFYELPVVRSAGAVVASEEAENDEPSEYAGYGGPIATEAEIPKTSDAFLIAAPPAVQFNVQPSEYKVQAQIGVVPKFSGGFRVPLAESVNKFNSEKNGKQAITNPAAFFMNGADLSKVAKPNCRMVGCDGPMANDDDVNVQLSPSLTGPNSQCHQTFVPLNGCVDGKGYPVGMMCTICCDCTASFKLEMAKSDGFKQGFRADLH